MAAIFPVLWLLHIEHDSQFQYMGLKLTKDNMDLSGVKCSTPQKTMQTTELLLHKSQTGIRSCK